MPRGSPALTPTAGLKTLLGLPTTLSGPAGQGLRGNGLKGIAPPPLLPTGVSMVADLEGAAANGRPMPLLLWQQLPFGARAVGGDAKRGAGAGTAAAAAKMGAGAAGCNVEACGGDGGNGKDECCNGDSKDGCWGGDPQ